MTFLITFSCYGAHLHGDESGTVDRRHRIVGEPLLEPDEKLRAAEKRGMDQSPYALDGVRRDAVLQALQHVCAHRGWVLLAAHVRTNHVHAVVRAEARPEKIMNAFKAYASRLLNEMQVDVAGRKRWARHGSTRWLITDDNITAAIHYVVNEQGDEMAVFQATAPKRSRLFFGSGCLARLNRFAKMRYAPGTPCGNWR